MTGEHIPFYLGAEELKGFTSQSETVTQGYTLGQSGVQTEPRRCPVGSLHRGDMANAHLRLTVCSR